MTSGAGPDLERCGELVATLPQPLDRVDTRIEARHRTGAALAASRHDPALLRLDAIGLIPRRRQRSRE